MTEKFNDLRFKKTLCDIYIKVRKSTHQLYVKADISLNKG